MSWLQTSAAPNEGVVEFTCRRHLGRCLRPGDLGGYRGVYELPDGTILTTTGTGVHEINRSGDLVQSKITGVSGRFIEYVVIGRLHQPGRHPVGVSTSPDHRDHARRDRTGRHRHPGLDRPGAGYLHRQPVHHQQRSGPRPRQRDRPGARAGDAHGDRHATKHRRQPAEPEPARRRPTRRRSSR